MQKYSRLNPLEGGEVQPPFFVHSDRRGPDPAALGNGARTALAEWPFTASAANLWELVLKSRKPGALCSRTRTHTEGGHEPEGPASRIVVEH